MELAIIIAVVVVALVFDYTNGFHDAANAIATSVSTRALTPRVALAMAAIMNFVGAFLGQEVAPHGLRDHRPRQRLARPGDRDVRPARCDHVEPHHLVLGLPSSSSHALIGGLVGAAVAAGATANWDGRGRQGRHPDAPLAGGRVLAWASR